MLLEWIVFSAFITYFSLIYSIWGALKYKKTMKKLMDGSLRRSKLYSGIIINSWSVAVVVLMVTITASSKINDIGLKGLKINSNRWFAYPVIILSVLYFCFLLYQTINIRFLVKRNQKVELKLSDEVAMILPHTGRERFLYVFVALTAGITEEIMFRGYLMNALERLIPGIPWPLILFIPVVVFGLAHAYQGKINILYTGLTGLAFGVIYMAFGSIIPVMIIHFIQDISAIDYIQVRASGTKEGQQEP